MAGSDPTITIPLTTFAVGATPFGPITLSQNVSASVVIDRTVAGGLNSLTSASVLNIEIDVSADGGTTWQTQVSTAPAGFVGGAIPAKGGGNRTSENLGVTGLSAGTEARVLVTVTGPSSVAIAGSVTVN